MEKISDEIIDLLVDHLTEVNMEDTCSDDQIEHLQSDFNCTIVSYTEKHNSLQYTFYFEVKFNQLTEESCLYVEIESGINNGTIIQNVSWEDDSRPKSRYIEVITDIEIDKTYYKTPAQLAKAKEILRQNKHKYLEHIRQNNYDNYVTGGNSKLKSNLPELEVNYITEIKEVNPNFI